MSELADILDAAARFASGGTAVALATVVATRGSTYRHAGARLVVPEDGDAVGTISGGCLEEEVTRLGREAIGAGQPRLVRFDLTGDVDAIWGLGLGCNGVIDVFIEPPAAAAATIGVLRAARDTAAGGGPAALVMVVASTDPDVPAGRQVQVAASSVSGAPGSPIDQRLADLGRGALRRGARPSLSGVQTDRGRLRVFVEPLPRPPRLAVCGAGGDAIPLVRTAAALGWRVTVADPRRRLLTHQRFPGAEAFVDGDPKRAAGRAGADERTFVVIMTHNFLRDAEYAGGFLATPAPYLGILGPRRRTERLLAELALQGVRVRAGDRRRIYAPAGLDLGGDEPDEIALAIVSEILAVRSGRSGGSLRDRRAPIHGGSGRARRS
jgi:xanthine dehydrogenase accessory factor